jgi:uncharacterized protein YigE (DUF2233 family)
MGLKAFQRRSPRSTKPAASNPVPKAVLAALAVALLATPASAACEAMRFEGEGYTVCRVDLATEHLALFNLDAGGEPFGSFSALAAALAEGGKTLAFAMNAGMFGEDLKPIGLYVESGKQGRKINRRNGSGNFHLKPNGVFFVMGGEAAVLETEAYVKRGVKPEFATQSGPMLVVNGRIHPKFSETGPSRKRRNGVCAPSKTQAVFAISDGVVNFHAFAKLFRDGLSCDNALYLDGSVSSLHAPELGRSDGFFDLGPIVAVVK